MAAPPAKQSPPLTADQALRLAVAHHQAGRLQDAERLYRAILQVQANHPDANHNLGVLAVQLKQTAHGLPHLKTALESNPDQEQYWLSYIDALMLAGRTDEARQVMLQGQERGLKGAAADALSARLNRSAQVAGEPRHLAAQAHDPGMARHSQPHLGESAPSPQEVDTLVSLFNEGRHVEAAALAQSMTERFPSSGIGWKALGVMLRQMGRNRDALAPMTRAAALAPEDIEIHNNLGVILKDLGRLTEAEACYRHALQSRPDYADALNNLGIVLQAQGLPSEAEASYRQALQSRPDFAEAHNNLGIIYHDIGRSNEAEACYRRALQSRPDYADALYNLGNTLQEQGRTDEAEACYRHALRIAPDLTTAYSSLLFIINYTSSATRCLEEARRYGQQVGSKIAARFSAWNCMDKPKRLRIGFISGDFRNHPVGFFMESLLACLDRSTIELTAYPTAHDSDELTERIKPNFTAWKPLAGLNDEMAARLIHGDGIHVLFDLSGHTPRNRLPLFAWKPAPVQVSWLGYFATTGVAEMDYLLADPYTLPESQDAYFTEKIWRLPETRLCFTPPDIEVEVSALPAQANGYVTFGCFNYLTKMNDEVIATWSRVLAAVPGSRLFLKAKQLSDVSARNATIERFAAHGIDAGRLVLEGPESRTKYLAAYQRVDISLDPFPYPGGTTTVEGLWMGVPVLTLAGENFLSRQGVGILMNAGLPEWVAAGREDYVSRAIAHSADLSRLACLRNELRQRLLASPIFDAQRFATHFQGALREMWRIWRKTHVKPRPHSARHAGPPVKEPHPSPREIETLRNLYNEGRLDEAVTLAQDMTKRFPRHEYGWKVLGAAFKQLGRNEAALTCKERAAALTPHDAEAHSNLGNTLQDLGRLDEAEACYRRALELKPGFAQAHNNLGNTLQAMGRLDEAANSYRRALEIKPDFAETLVNLALLSNAQGQPEAALNTVMQSLRIRETPDAKKAFVASVKRLHFTHVDSEIRAAVVRALTEPWGRPYELARASADLCKLDPLIGGAVKQAAEAWPAQMAAPAPLAPNAVAVLAGDPLLHALLDSTPVCDLEMERFLTVMRQALLLAATHETVSGAGVDATLSFHALLARQCFINEYVFSCTDDELRQASDLRDSLTAALTAGAPPPARRLLAVASYFPLCSLPHAARLLETQWPEAVATVLAQQVSEPLEEMQTRTDIPRLTGIEDDVSQQVRNQYEANPYPRWVRIPPTRPAVGVAGYLGQKFPLVAIADRGGHDGTDILIAGCGTGQHPIGTAQQFPGARVLAVDLSLSSLAYARRKSRELGLTNISYAQADLLKLGSLARTFDVIESVGVLHHLADPWAGWQVLLSLLRPGGFMRLGFYSEAARRNIVRIRALIAEQGYGSSPQEIRRCRQSLIDLDKDMDFGNVLKSPDFFSTSDCRDLLFHVQEHRMTLTAIDAFLRASQLAFLGFDIDAATLHAYRRRFPGDPTATDLAQWQTFENDNPDTFYSMYQFWIQKVA